MQQRLEHTLRQKTFSRRRLCRALEWPRDNLILHVEHYPYVTIFMVFVAHELLPGKQEL